MSLATLFSTFNMLVALGVLIFFGISLLIYTKQITLKTAWIHMVILVLCCGIFIIPQIYERVFGFPPCLLCWLQRICMWPVALLTPVAIYRKQLRLLIPYFSILLVIAAIIGIYHFSLQFGVAPVTIACGAVGQSVSCGGIEVMVFDFLTIPLMAVLSNLALILLFRNYAEAK
jgi:disulfide bond formation protein DsbB